MNEHNQDHKHDLVTKAKVRKDADVINPQTGKAWLYSDVVKEHFFNPKNLLLEEPKEGEYDAEGIVGSPACGDMMNIWLKIDSKTEQITVCKWKTFGCGSAIASTSMMSEMVTENGGMTLDQALKLKPQDIIGRLHGLPNRKIHCSVLGDKALRKAINDYFRKTSQFDRIVVDGAKVIDERLNITDHDIEEAVLEGATDLDSVQKKLKVGVGFTEEAKDEIRQLIRFYTEKYYG